MTTYDLPDLEGTPPTPPTIDLPPLDLDEAPSTVLVQVPKKKLIKPKLVLPERRRWSLEEVEMRGGYDVIYIDAPWSYKNRGRGAAANHYATVEDVKLAQLPINRLAAPNAVIFMWATWPNLPLALATMAAWRFWYMTLGFVWIKLYQKALTPFWGGGFWTRANSEVCLLGVRGDLRRLDAGVHQLVETWEEQDDLVLRRPIGGHSAKPPEVRDRIVKLMGSHLSMVELFARCVDEYENVIPAHLPGGRVHPNFEQWGDQCDSDLVLPWSADVDNKEKTP